jgi:hypothetical protein
VIILGVVYFNGTRTVDQGAQGTIGGAERYRGAQPANVAVKEGDVQKFLQSDVFDRIIKDEHVLKLLDNKEARGVLGSDEFTALVKSQGAKESLMDAETAVELRNWARIGLKGSDTIVSVIADEQADLMRRWRGPSRRI